MNDLKSNLQDDEVLIHVDFSENYCTKYAKEIQAFHFGGSRVQLSLHTVVVYLRNSILSFCTVSENIAHSTAAIWTHLRPIFKTLPRGIKRVHFLSDGLVTQYRNKTMFFIMATKLFKEIPDIENCTWNYTESGHGKGAPDGIGATCKRTADFVVNSGGDINNIDQFVKVIEERCLGITCIAIDGKHIQAMVDQVEEEAADKKGFKGTLNVHQHHCNSSESCEHYKIVKPRWTVEEVFTESEPADLETAKPELIPAPNKFPQRFDDVIAGTSGTRNSYYNTGDYVLVKYPAKNVEYRYAAVINEIDDDEDDKYRSRTEEIVKKVLFPTSPLRNISNNQYFDMSTVNISETDPVPVTPVKVILEDTDSIYLPSSSYTELIPMKIQCKKSDVNTNIEIGGTQQEEVSELVSEAATFSPISEYPNPQQEPHSSSEAQNTYQAIQQPLLQLPPTKVQKPPEIVSTSAQASTK
ncbi:unnamed protein product [Psylliodes chrysocephalus]|uniref:Uncharacterized protein n=1 Tax=Psylliodes chrysocephalus TaxID=3402493 RepID=A0A9P0CS27_9CUCU|nr:unnamed protein product [Psylliodes chrysocephala]